MRAPEEVAGDAAPARAGLGRQADRRRARLQPQHGEALPAPGRLGAAYRTPRRPRRWTGWRAGSRERFRRHRGNADVVRQELLAEHGVAVSLRTVERAVRPMRQRAGGRGARDDALRDPAGPSSCRSTSASGGRDRRRAGRGSTCSWRRSGYSRRLHRARVPRRAPGALVRRARERVPPLRRRAEEVLLDNPRALVAHHDAATPRGASSTTSSSPSRSTGASGRAPARRTGRAPRARTRAASAT